MLRKFNVLAICLLSIAVTAQASANSGLIHKTTTHYKQCFEMRFSTKVGNLVNGKCAYTKETPVDSRDDCDVELSGFRLQQEVGLGYNCAATHVQHQVDKKILDGLDEFKLVVNSEGEYVGSTPEAGDIYLTD